MPSPAAWLIAASTWMYEAALSVRLLPPSEVMTSSTVMEPPFGPLPAVPTVVTVTSELANWRISVSVVRMLVSPAAV